MSSLVSQKQQERVESVTSTARVKLPGFGREWSVSSSRHTTLSRGIILEALFHIWYEPEFCRSD